jgi:predicted N-acetyltransferase YhbS
MKARTDSVDLRDATEEDLAAINEVIERAVMTWNLPERVKRLSLANYRYQSHDHDYLHIVAATEPSFGIVGVTAWEDASHRDLPSGKSGLLLHGLYVDPSKWHRGIGSRLLAHAMEAVREENRDGLLVKSQADAAGFFAGQGMHLLPVTDAARDYPRRYWWRNDLK